MKELEGEHGHQVIAHMVILAEQILKLDEMVGVLMTGAGSGLEEFINDYKAEKPT